MDALLLGVADLLRRLRLAFLLGTGSRDPQVEEGERARIMGELQGQVTSLAIELAEKVVEANLDEAANTRLIESYINQLSSR